MLDVLNKLLCERKELIDLINDAQWESLVINKRNPHTYRVFTYWRQYRIALHKFDVINGDPAFDHPHPWPGAFAILKGAYRMRLGRSEDRFSLPVPVSDVVLGAGSSYEITDPLVWHSVTPLMPTYTIMLNGEPFDDDEVHTQVRTTKGKDLEKLTDAKMTQHKNAFIRYIDNYLKPYGRWERHTFKYSYRICP